LIGLLQTIMGEQEGKLKGAGAGFKPKTSPLPEFLTDIKDKAAEAAEPLEKVATAVQQLEEDTAEPIVARFSLEGLEAVEGRSAAFIRKWMEFQSNMAGGKLGGGIGPFKNREDMLKSRREQFSTMMDRRRKGAGGKVISARRQAVLDRRKKGIADRIAKSGRIAMEDIEDKPYFPRNAGQNVVDKASSAISMIDKADEMGLTPEQILARNEAASGAPIHATGGPMGGATDGLIAAIMALKTSIENNTNTIDGNPTVVLEPSEVA
jgi:hypothetical protein